MGIRIEVAVDESIADALKRFRWLLRAEVDNPLLHYWWHKKRRDYYEKPSVYRRRRHYVAIEKRKRRWPPGPIDDLTYAYKFCPRRFWANL